MNGAPKSAVMFLIVLLPGLGWLGFSQSSQAATLYRCIDGHGNVSYQNAACNPGSRLDRSLDYRPDSTSTVPAEARLYRYQPRYPVRAARFRSRSQSRRAAIVPTASAVCHAAREHRRAELERLGLRRTYTQLSQLDANVRAACHGF